MPTTLGGRDLVKDYLKENKISIASLATTYSVGKMYMGQVLDGTKTSAAANKLVLKIIDDFKIRAKED
ncbi:XRE family transcriptional regulator [Paucilactobacillus sp. N302-9]